MWLFLSWCLLDDINVKSDKLLCLWCFLPEDPKYLSNTKTLYIKWPESGTMKPIISVKLINMPTDKWKVHLQQLVLFETSGSAVPQFHAEDEYRNGLYTANIFLHTKKTMIMFIQQQKEDSLPFHRHQSAPYSPTFANDPLWWNVLNPLFFFFERYATKVKPGSCFLLWTRFLGGKIAPPWSLLMMGQGQRKHGINPPGQLPMRKTKRWISISFH